MRWLRALGMGLWLMAGSAFAAEPVSLSYQFSPLHGPPVYVQGQKLKTGAAPAETLVKEPKYSSENPLYGIATLGTGDDTTFTFVLDESEGTGKGYDLLYVDSNNNEDLTDDPPVRATQRQGRQVFSPIRLLVPVNGQKTLYQAELVASPHYESKQRQVTGTDYYLKGLGYFVGSARFGDKTYSVALVDYNANGLFNDLFTVFDPEGDKTGDMLLVDLDGDGEFAGKYPTLDETIHCGKRIVVDNQFYDFAARPDGVSFSVAPSQVNLRPIKSEYSRFSLTLASAEGQWPIEAETGEAKAPPGTYQVTTWSLDLKDAKRRTWHMAGHTCGGDAPPPQLTVSEPDGGFFKLRAPLLAKVRAERSPEEGYKFQFELRLSAAEHVTDLKVNDAKPPEPLLRILDEKGRQVEKLKFHYG